MRTLSDEISSLKSSLATTNTEKQSLTHTNDVKQIKDLWQANLAATSAIKNRIDGIFRELDIAEQRSDEVDNHLKRLKCDLKSYYNSAFFQEDSKLIKEIHRSLVPPPLVPISSIRRAPNTSLSQPSPTPVSPSSSPPSHSPPDHQSSPNQLQSRRSSGYTMTQGGNLSRSSAPIPGAASRTAPNASSSRNRPNQSTGSTAFKTVLITDSILRHVQNMDTAAALGTNHILHMINKRDSSGLGSQEVRNELMRIKPDFIYIHLGVNDVTQRFSLKKSLKNFYEFVIFTEGQLPNAKTFLSLPLMTGDNEANERISELRHALQEFVLRFYQTGPVRERTLFINPNRNFVRSGRLVGEYYKPDGVHPSDRGREVILGNMRHSIHEITRVILNRPKRTSRRPPRT